MSGHETASTFPLPSLDPTVRRRVRDHERQPVAKRMLAVARYRGRMVADDEQAMAADI